MEVIIAAVLFGAVGMAVGVFVGRSNAVALRERANQLHARVDDLVAERETMQDQLNDALQQAAVAETKLVNAQSNDDRLVSEFARLSKATLADQGEVERERIAHMVKPVQDNLAKLEAFIQSSGQQQSELFGGLFQQMKDVAEQSSRVGNEALALKNVLRSSTSTRGRWGEVQLRRVVELAGMVEHADFSEQTSVSHDEGRSRADLVVYLPGNMQIAVDAKVPYGAYEQAQSTDDPVTQKRFLEQHAKQFRAHVEELHKRAYWDVYAPSCGFAVLFVPGEALLDSALMHDTGLWEQAAERNILLATPSTLIALLRMAAMGWRQEAQAENAEEITRVGRELYRRLVRVSTEAEKLGRGLRTAVGSYNAFVGSFEGRVLPQARRLSDLGAGDNSLTAVAEVDASPRALRASESGQLFDEAELPEDDEYVADVRKLKSRS